MSRRGRGDAPWCLAARLGATAQTLFLENKINRLYRLEKNMQPEDFMSQVPLWVVVSLGKEVIITKDFVGPCETYPKGCRGILTAIEVYASADRIGKPYATVALDPNDYSYLENFDFQDIEPVVRKIKYSLNIERGVIAF